MGMINDHAILSASFLQLKGTTQNNVYKLHKQFQKNYVAIGLCSNWKSNTIPHVFMDSI